METLIDPHRDDPADEGAGEGASAAEASGDGGLTGQVLDGRYELTQQLGAGGMGVVYAAKHVVLGGRLAVKVLRPPPTTEVREAMERFEREARAASALGHPHIVDIKDFGTLPSGSSYYVMEHLDGHDLLAEVERNGPLAVVRLAKIGAQIAEALSAAHAQGIVHRDLKPENVFLTTRAGVADHVKLIDFGIAKVSGGDVALGATLPPLAALAMQVPSNGRFTAAGIVLGTPAYMSPEQCAGGDVDFRTDVYALGVLLYEAGTGRLPFDADSVFDLMRKHQHEAPRDPRELRADLPEPIAQLVLSMLAKDPSARPASMRVVHEALTAFTPAAPVRDDAALEAAIRRSVVAPRSAVPSETPARLVLGELRAAPSPSSPPETAIALAPRSRSPWALAAVGAAVMLVAIGVGAGAVAWIAGPSTSSVSAPAISGDHAAPAASAGTAPAAASPTSITRTPDATAAPPAVAAPAVVPALPPVATAGPSHAVGPGRRTAHTRPHPTEPAVPTAAATPEAPTEAAPTEPSDAPATTPRLRNPRPTDAVRDPWGDTAE